MNVDTTNQPSAGVGGNDAAGNDQTNTSDNTDTEDSTDDALETEDSDDEGQTGEGDDEGDGETTATAEEETEDFEHEGKKFKIPKALKEGFMKGSDYTQKTQALAEQRRALDNERAADLKLSEEYVQAKAELVHIDKQLGIYKDMTTQAWAELRLNHPEQYQTHWDSFLQLQFAKQEVVKNYETKEKDRAETQRQAVAKQEADAEAYLTKEIPGITAQKVREIVDYGGNPNTTGYTTAKVAEEVRSNPRLAVFLNRMMALEAENASLKTKATKVKTLVAQQQTQPAAQVKASTGTQQTKDPGKMSPEQYRKARESGRIT